MLAEVSVVEQRYLTVREVLDSGARISDVAVRYGVDRRSLKEIKQLDDSIPGELDTPVGAGGARE